MILPNSLSFSYTLSKAIPILDSKGGVIDLRAVYEKIYELVRIEAEKYQDSVIKTVKIRFFFYPKSIQSYEEYKKMSNDEIKLVIQNIWNNCLEPGHLPDPQSLASKKSRIPKFITTLQNRSQNRRPFIVADIETVLISEVHVPYAAGLLVVKPGDDLTSIPPHSINVYFCEEEIQSNPNGKEFTNVISLHFQFRSCSEG